MIDKGKRFGGITEVGGRLIEWSFREEDFYPTFEALPKISEDHIAACLAMGQEFGDLEYLDKSNKRYLCYEGWWSICNDANKRKTFEVPTKFIFSGVFRVTAGSHEQAEEFVQKHCGLVIGGDIHSSLPSDDIDWEFITHPEKIVGIAECLFELQE